MQLRVAGALTVASGAIYVTHLEPVPLTQRKHLVLCSEAQERAVGAQAAAQVAQRYRALPPSAPASRRVARISQRLVTALREDARLRGVPHLANMQWRFSVIDSPDINAFVVPGGDAFVFTGLLRAFPEDDALAMVLAHEMGHVVARHAAEKLSSGLIATLLKIALAVLTGQQGASDALVELGLSLPFSRRAEREADAIGIILMARACFDPGAAPGVFERLGKLQGGVAPPEWLSTHPASAERVRALRSVAAQAAREFAAAGCTDVSSAWGAAGLEPPRREQPVFGFE
jgi:predicted Zn-dependent protease